MPVLRHLVISGPYPQPVVAPLDAMGEMARGRVFFICSFLNLVPTVPPSSKTSHKKSHNLPKSATSWLTVAHASSVFIPGPDKTQQQQRWWCWCQHTPHDKPVHHCSQTSLLASGSRRRGKLFSDWMSWHSAT